MIPGRKLRFWIESSRGNNSAEIIVPMYWSDDQIMSDVERWCSKFHAWHSDTVRFGWDDIGDKLVKSSFQETVVMEKVAMPSLIDVGSAIGDLQSTLIKVEASYLAKYYGRWYAGTFSKRLYGWNFSAVYLAGVPLDAKGFETLFEIVEN